MGLGGRKEVPIAHLGDYQFLQQFSAYSDPQ